MDEHFYLYQNQLDAIIQQYNRFFKLKPEYEHQLCLYIALYSLDHQHYFYKFFRSLANNKNYHIGIISSNHAHFEHTDEVMRFTKKNSFYTIACYIHK